jgi:hypothetical protein
MDKGSSRMGVLDEVLRPDYADESLGQAREAVAHAKVELSDCPGPQPRSDETKDTQIPVLHPKFHPLHRKEGEYQREGSKWLHAANT